VDVQIEVLPVTRADRLSATPGESTAAVAARVDAARSAARVRLAGTGWRTNAAVPGSWLRDNTPRAAGHAELDRALDTGALSLRGRDRVLRLAWTVADLRGAPVPDAADVGEALLLRTRGRLGG
jgi:magnesium chelatase family protein